jgi:hypothetical protein
VNTALILSKLIDNFYAKTKIEKVLALFNELRSGRHYAASKIRKFLIGNYKSLILNLTDEEFVFVKQVIIDNLPKLINERNSQKIAYSLLSQFIEYSCRGEDLDVYYAYEKEILRLAQTNKEKYIFHIITLAQTRKRMFNDITNIEDFFIKQYLRLSRLKSINYKHLLDFSINVDCERRRFLLHLFKLKPFRNDFIINSFILQFDELKKLGLLI